MGFEISVDAAAIRGLAGSFDAAELELSAASEAFTYAPRPAADAFGRTDGSAAAAGSYAEVRDRAVQMSQQLQAALRRHSAALADAAESFDRAEDRSREIAETLARTPR